MKKLWKKYGSTMWIVLLAVILLVNPVSAAAAGGRADLKTTDLRTMSGWPAGPEINSRSAYLIELNTGSVLFGKNEDETRYPASITKVMTALLVIENCDLNEQVTFSHDAVTDIEDGGHSWEYKEGEVLTVEQCLYALLLESVNEAGYALAEHVAGSLDAFAQMMNEKARALGCTKTNFTNPHGLNDENHTTTAHDMALIFWAALQNETFFRIDSALSYMIPPTALNSEGFNLAMHHKMMLPDSDKYYDGVKAGKTGYTSIAMNTLVTYAERDGMEFVCVCMKAGGNGAIYEDTKRLLDYAFENFQLADMTETARDFCHGLNTAYPMPLLLEGEGLMLLPKSVNALTMEFAGRGADDENGVIGHLLFRNGDQIMGSNTIRVDDDVKLSQNAVNGDVPKETEKSEETGENKESEGNKLVVSDEEESVEKEKEGKSFLFWILMVILGLIILVFIYWAVIQVIKYRRRQRKKNLRRMRQRRNY